MFGRNRQSKKDSSQSKSWRWRRRAERRQESAAAEGPEVFADFLNAIGSMARGQAFYYADHYRNQAADVVADLAESLRDVAQERAYSGERSPLTEGIADDLEDLSDVIRDIRLNAALNEVQRLARRRPVVFGIGAIAAGYLVTRAISRNPASGNGRRGGRF